MAAILFDRLKSRSVYHMLSWMSVKNKRAMESVASAELIAKVK